MTSYEHKMLILKWIREIESKTPEDIQRDMETMKPSEFQEYYHRYDKYLNM